MNINFTDKVVVVTGGAGGFGSATARSFGEAGAQVVIADINGEAAESLANEIPSAVGIQADSTTVAGNEAIIDAAIDSFGNLDVLVNNAGAPVKGKPLAEMSSDEVAWLIDINLRSAILASKFAIPHLQKREGSSIVNIASISANRPRPNAAIYATTKAGVQGLTLALASELAPDIRVNGINPVVANTGFIKNQFGHTMTDDELRENVVSTIPMGRTAHPQDIANSVLFIASKEASLITGHLLNVDGGRNL